MAKIKGWKKVTNTKYRNGTTLLAIIGYGWVFPDFYVVRVWSDEGWTSEKLIYASPDYKSFKRAKQDAKEYMRSHPRG